MIIRTRIWVKTIFNNIIQNPLRLALSVTGLVLSSTVIALSVFYLDAIYNAKMEECEFVPDNCFLVYGYHEEDEKLLVKIESEIIPHFERGRTGGRLLLSMELGGDSKILCTIVGIPANEQNIAYWYDGMPQLRRNDLQYGRFIQEEDLDAKKKVCVIDQYSASALFGTDSCLGQFVTIDTDINRLSFQVVGVQTNNYGTELDNKTRMTQEDAFVSTTVYIPLTTFEELFANSYYDSVCLYVSNSENALNSQRKAIDRVFGAEEDVYFVDKKGKIKNVFLLMKETKEEILPIIIFVFVFSGLNSMNIYLFSTKERFGEIGIRKAFGAGKEDIVFQFMMEYLVISFFASIVSVLIASLLMILWGGSVLAIGGISLSFEPKMETVLFPIAVSMLQGLLFSLIPGIYASHISVVKSLRFE